MKIDKFKEDAEKLIDQLEDLIQQLPQKGDTSDTCQRVTLQQALNEFSYTVNGTEQEDLDNECKTST